MWSLGAWGDDNSIKRDITPLFCNNVGLLFSNIVQMHIDIGVVITQTKAVVIGLAVAHHVNVHNATAAGRHMNRRVEIVLPDDNDIISTR